MYRLTDIWGNTRVTYADDNGDGVVGTSEIRREQNYYPGGLEHRGYNSGMYGVKNNLKTFQGQEFTENLGLNTHEWKYRISDPATLRFWQIDPLAEDYYYNATYAFAENKLGMGIELEGAEIHTWLQQKAVEDAVRNPNGVGAHTIGVSQGLANSVTDVVDAVSNPVQTLKGAGNAALWLAVGSQFSEQVDGALGTNSSGAGDAILSSVVQGGNNLINGNGIERGTTIGEIGGAALGTNGVNAALKGVTKTAGIGTKMQNIANKASGIVGEGSGAVHGTKVHTQFGNMAEAINGVTKEVSYLNGRVVKYGTKGSVRADAVYGPVNKPTVIYDLKTGGAKLTQKNINKYNQHVPGKPPVYEIKPNN